MALIRRNQNWLPSVFNDLFDNDWIERSNSISAPAINVVERENEYCVEIAAPGMTKEDFNVHLDEEGNVVVSLEKKEENNENKEKGHYLRREFSYTQFRQVMILPDDVDRDKISAHVENGILTVELLKKSKEEPKNDVRKIEIR